MQAIVSVTLPFFALVLLGYLAARRRLLPESAIPGLNAYVLFFALPCLLYRFGASMPLRSLLDPALVGLYATAAMLLVALTIAFAARPGRVGWRNAGFGALVAAFPNSGFMGVPLLAALHGPAAAGPVIGTLLVDLFLTSTLCLALAQSEGAGDAAAERKAWRTVGRALRGAAANPQPWAIALGALTAATGAALPAPAAQLLRMLADSATPVALFTIGAVLWRAGQHATGRTPPGDYLPLAAIKLVGHPAIVGALGLGARAAGARVDSFGLSVLVLAAALPSASNVSLLAERWRADNGRVARVILASTVFAFVSFTGIAWVVERLGP